MANRGQLQSPWPTIAALAWGAAFIAYVWFVFISPRPFADIAPVGPRSLVIYLCSVVGMLLIIRIGTKLLDDAGQVELRPALIVMAVGLHFLPFAAAFHTPMFVTLGSVMALLGGAGLGVGWIWHDHAAAAAAVVTGVVMLAIIAADAGRHRYLTH